MNTNMFAVNGSYLPDPSALTWGLQDVSAPDAGRDESSTMHKMRVAQKRTYQVEWKMTNPLETAQILTAVNPETFTVTAWDAMDGQYETRTYYVGDRSAPFQQWHSGVDGQLFTKISFTIIEV